MDYTLSITDTPKTLALQRALDAYNASNTPVTAEVFLQKMMDGHLDSLVNSYLRTSVTKLEFLDRFTQSERITIRTAAQTIPEIADYLAMLDAVQDNIVVLTDPRTIGGAQALEDAGFIDEGRAAQILSLF